MLPLIAATALSIGGQVVNHMAASRSTKAANAAALAEAQRQEADRQDVIRVNNLERGNTLAARNLTINALQSRIAEESQSAGEDAAELAAQRRQATGRVNAAAAHAGVQGNTVDALVREQYAAFSRAATQRMATLGFSAGQLQREQQAAELSAKARLDSIRDPLPGVPPLMREAPSSLGLLFSMGATAAGAWADHQRVNRVPRDQPAAPLATAPTTPASRTGPGGRLAGPV